MTGLLYRGLVLQLLENSGASAVKAYVIYYGTALLCGVIAYLLGSVNFAIMISKAKYGEDIRTKGSGNAGATNMLRTYGKGAAAATLVCDILKCAVSVMIARLLVGYDLAGLAGFCCSLGHAFPCWYKFRGGKCVAVTAAFILCTEPIVFLIVLVAFIAIVAMTKYVSLGSVFSALLCPIVLYNYEKIVYNLSHGTMIVFFMFMTCMLVVFMHKDNIRRLREGKENKLGSHKQ